MRWKARQRSFPDGPDWDVEAGDRRCVVAVPPGQDRLLRLEAAVNAALGVSAAPPPDPPRWSIERDEHHGGGLFELEITIRWYIRDAEGARRWMFEGGESASYDGGGWSGGGTSGCDEVVLGADGAHVLVRDSEEVDSWPLPIGG